MKTKTQIVEKLLEEKKINAEEAVVLLMQDKEKEYVYIPQPYPYNYPQSPWTVGDPIWIFDPNSLPRYNYFPNHSIVN